MRVYLDTNVFKFSAIHLLRMRRREQEVDWGGHITTLEVQDAAIENPNDQLEDNSEIKREAGLLREVAELGTDGQVDFIKNIETDIERFGLPNLDSLTKKFYNAPIKTVDAPIQYRRIMFTGERDHYKEEQFNFLRTIKHERFSELQRITGAYQGVNKTNRNQLLDAFHIWCAEHHGCDFFLSLDFKLARMIQQSRNKTKVKIVRPPELLAAIKQEIDSKET